VDTTRREFVRLVGLGGVAGAGLLAGCEQAFDDLALRLEEEKTFQPPSGDAIDDIAHAVNRLTFGPRPGDYARVRELGVEAFIDEQLDPGSIPDRRCEWRIRPIESIHLPRGELFNVHPKRLLFDLTRAKLLRAVYSKRQLREVMVDFWTDHFNIAIAKDGCRWLKVADDRDVIRKHTLGSFRDLVRASALSPAMLIYLDGHDNKVRHPEEKPNENYARELLELHTLGVDGGYTQNDVMEVARCLSGWTYGHTFLRQDRVRFVPENHDNGAKTVLGERIPAGGGADDLERVLDIVCAHPSTARHLAAKLCAGFISGTDEAASQDAVAEVAATFQRTGGDIRATLRTLFTTDAFRGNRGNLFKRPFHYVVSALRATDAWTDAGQPLHELLERMGHAPFQYPTPDGFPIEPTPWTGTLLWRWNFTLALSRNRITGTRIEPDRLVEDLGGPEAVAAHVLGRAMNDDERAVLAQADPALGLLLASPAFQRH